MVTKEELSKMGKEEVYSLYKKKKSKCKTIEQEVNMMYDDLEFIAIRERLKEFKTRKE